MSQKSADKAARRKVRKSSPFVDLIRTGSCAVQKYTHGNTKHSVDVIKDIAYKYAFQTKDAAKKLLGKTLAETISNDYDFLYKDFQYKSDPELQQMRSPICSKLERFSGIDCKSFSILASTLLLNQQIVHYIRRIKQPSYEPNYWTHVYIVIPKNQTNYNLNEGYYIIDATLHNNIESNFLEKHDTLMSNLPHVWLNGPAASTHNEELQDAVNDFNDLLQRLADKAVSSSIIVSLFNKITHYTNQNLIPSVEFEGNTIVVENQSFPVGLTYPNIYASGLRGGFGGFGENGSNEQFDGVFDDISSFFNDIFGGGWSPSCVGGTYSRKDVKYVEPLVIIAFDKLYTDFNTALTSNNIALIQENINKVLKYSAGFEDHATRTAAKSWSSSCSKQATRAFRKMGQFFGDIASQAFSSYVNQYFTFSTSTISMLNVDYKNIPLDTRTHGKGFKQRDFKKTIDVPQIQNLAFKGEDVPFFEFTPYLKQSIANESFNAQQLLTELTNIAIQFQSDNNGSSNGNPNGNTNGNSNTIGDAPDAPPSKAGFGIVPTVLITGAVGYGLYEFYRNNKEKSSKSA
jgi:hypothetical protein